MSDGLSVVVGYNHQPRQLQLKNTRTTNWEPNHDYCNSNLNSDDYIHLLLQTNSIVCNITDDYFSEHPHLID
ncbi:hypothetical protein GJ496_006656 [Pomphorhynchus laevis]|nr:hypothetical protein GJ496_008380 [Pomphorhynchus laevis]KAI0988011.1 hypothetical protein GJ496_006656 [Pomphorhynchus laevis]